MRPQSSEALVLHVRPYRESSALVQFFSREFGRVVAVMHGVRGERRRHNVQPFSAGQLLLVGRGNLQTVRSFDVSRRFGLRGDALSSGFYVLELATRVLDERQAEPRLYRLLLDVLTDLQALEISRALGARLRVFERQLLQLLGFGIDFEHDVLGQSITGHEHYRFDPQVGFQRCEMPDAAHTAIAGQLLLAIAQSDYAQPGASAAARKIFAAALQPLIGSKPLLSRTLLVGGAKAGADG